MKKAAFLIVSEGEDGRGPESIRHAFWEEGEREAAWDKMKPEVRGYYRKVDRVVEVNPEKCLRKLDGLDRLILGI